MIVKGLTYRWTDMCHSVMDQGKVVHSFNLLDCICMHCESMHCVGSFLHSGRIRSIGLKPATPSFAPELGFAFMGGECKHVIFPIVIEGDCLSIS